MIWVSFFRPIGIFEGAFNRLAAWWTSGEYCHCELIFHVEPIPLMAAVKNVYKSGTKKTCAELEINFFENKDHKYIMQNNDKVYVSFSLLWGDQVRVRFLQHTEDPWFSTPDEDFEDMTWVSCPGIPDEKQHETLEWALGEITKPYNESAAFFSWIPSWSANDVSSRESYFCSEFASMSLVKMGRLKPFATHHCTPNNLITILRAMNEEEEEIFVSSSEDELPSID